MRNFGFLVLALLLVAEQEAFTSKYTGPRSADVRCKVVRTVKEAPSTAQLAWSLQGAQAATIVEAKLTDVLAFDDNGWANNRKAVPSPIYVKVSGPLEAAGTKLLVHLSFSPKYAGKMSITGSVVSSRAILEHPEKPAVTKEKALEAAREDGFSSTWSNLKLIGGNWHISGHSKSAMPPMYFVVDGVDGKVVYRSTNSDVDQLPEEFKKTKPAEEWDLMDDRWIRTSTADS